MHVTNNYLTRGVNRTLCKAVSHVAEDKTQAEVFGKQNGETRELQDADGVLWLECVVVTLDAVS